MRPTPAREAIGTDAGKIDRNGFPSQVIQENPRPGRRESSPEKRGRRKASPRNSTRAVPWAGSRRAAWPIATLDRPSSAVSPHRCALSMLSPLPRSFAIRDRSRKEARKRDVIVRAARDQRVAGILGGSRESPSRVLLEVTTIAWRGLPIFAASCRSRGGPCPGLRQR